MRIVANHPTWQDIVRKHAWTAPVVGLIGTSVGIFRGLQRLPGRNPIDQLLPGIVEALIWTAVGIFVSVLVVMLHTWLIKR